MEDKDKKSSGAKEYMRYSGMAFELIGLMVIAILAGKKIDQWLHFDTAYGTLSLLILFLIAYFVRVYYSLMK